MTVITNHKKMANDRHLQIMQEQFNSKRDRFSKICNENCYHRKHISNRCEYEALTRPCSKDIAADCCGKGKSWMRFREIQMSASTATEFTHLLLSSRPLSHRCSVVYLLRMEITKIGYNSAVVAWLDGGSAEGKN